MRKLTYLIGLLACIAVSMGWLFTVLHWPGGREIFNYGFLSLTLIFPSLLLLLHIGTLTSKAFLTKFQLITGLLSAWIAGLSLVFKFFHFPGASGLLITGIVLFSFGFLPLFFFSLYKKGRGNTKLK